MLLHGLIIMIGGSKINHIVFFWEHCFQSKLNYTVFNNVWTSSKLFKRHCTPAREAALIVTLFGMILRCPFTRKFIEYYIYIYISLFIYLFIFILKLFCDQLFYDNEGREQYISPPMRANNHPPSAVSGKREHSPKICSVLVTYPDLTFLREKRAGEF
jgi:hypothetical protein